MTPIQSLTWTATKHGSEIFKLARHVLDDPRFAIWSGSSSQYTHHYGPGQLAQHTMEVADLCALNNAYYSRPVRDDLLFLAALFHDAGKMWDYEPLPPEGERKAYQEWQSTDHKSKVYHISRSALIWQAAFTKDGDFLSTADSDEVLHAILAHHGQLIWKSPVTPKTKMAWLLHLSDSISARLDDCIKTKPNETKT